MFRDFSLLPSRFSLITHAEPRSSNESRGGTIESTDYTDFTDLVGVQGGTPSGGWRLIFFCKEHAPRCSAFLAALGGGV